MAIDCAEPRPVSLPAAEQPVALPEGAISGAAAGEEFRWVDEIWRGVADWVASVLVFGNDQIV